MSRIVRQMVVFIACCSLSGSLLAQHITVVSWGGSYARACEEAYHKPFEAETGIRVRLEDYNGGLAQVRSQVDAGAIYWDVVDLELADAIRGCDEGLFELLDPAGLAPAPDGRAVEEDFYPDTLGECGLGSVFYSTVFAYSPARRSADDLISTHLETGVQMRPHMPNTPEHTERALRSDWAWWSENGDEMNERFVVWLLQ